MNMKKIISAFCALSLAASSFVSMAINASAEGETVLWSDTFNGYENVVEHTNQKETLGSVLVDGTSIAAAKYEGIEGITLTTTNRADDSSWFKLNDKESAGDKCLTTMVSRFSNQDRGANIAFNTPYAAEAGKDVVLAFKVSYNNTEATTFESSLTIGSTVFNLKDAGIAQDTWTDVKVVVNTSGTSVYVGDSTTAAATGTDTQITNIKFNGLVGGSTGGDAQKASTHPTGYPTFSLDDIVVYNAADGLASTVPAAETHGNVAVVYENAPTTTVPEGFNTFASLDFNKETPARLIFTNDGNTDGYSAFKGLLLTAGQGGSDTRPESRWDTRGNAKGDPTLGTDIYLLATNGKGSTANRGPKIEFKKDITDRETVGVKFAARLHKSETAPAEIIFSGDLVASESKGNLASPIAMITTDAEADSGVYACDNPLTKVADGGTNILQVADNEWVIVTIEATKPKDKAVTASISVTTNVGKEDEATTYIFGSETEKVTVQDSTKSGISTLPFVSFRSGNDTDYGVSDTANDIDNIVIYTDGSVETPVVPDVPTTATITSATTVTADAESATAVVVKATPNEDGTMTVELHKGLTAGENTIEWKNAAKAGDKVMAFTGFTTFAPAALAPFVVE